MKHALTAFVFFCSLVLAHALAFDANLDPFQEVPPNASPGFGSVDLTLSGTNLSVNAGTGSYSDLLAGATSVRLADAAPGANGPTIFTLTLDTPGNASGSFSGAVGLTPAEVTDLLAGNLYLNISDPVFPSGEIRGQISEVPEPTTLTLLGVGSLACLALRSRRLKKS